MMVSSRVEEIISFLNEYTIVGYSTMLQFFNGYYSQIERLFAENDEPIAIIVTGPIASGKSTMVYNLINSHLFGNLDFKSTDAYMEYNGIIMSSDRKDYYDKYKALCYKEIENAIKNKYSFIWETVISKEEKFKWIDIIKNNNYKIIGVYIGNDNINLNIDRARFRENYGKWHVDDKKIISRYNICMKNLRRFSKLTDETIIVDTTNNNACLAAYCEEGNVIYKDNSSCNWINKYI